MIKTVDNYYFGKLDKKTPAEIKIAKGYSAYYSGNLSKIEQSLSISLFDYLNQKIQITICFLLLMMKKKVIKK